MELLISIVIFGFFLSLGWFIGRAREQRHLRELERREAATADMLVTQLKSFPSALPGDQPPHLIVAETVIGSDYLKTFLGNLINIFGGEVRGFETMLSRSRREATLRILEEAKRQGYNAICNLRLENADIGGNASGGSNNRGMVMATILASATAYHARR